MGAALAAGGSRDISHPARRRPRAKISAVTGLIIEGGVYFLLLFTPFAFGGVEMWAQGVVQIISGVVFTAWCWQRLGNRDETSRVPPSTPGVARALRVIWVTIGLFVLLTGLQLVPLSPAWIRALSPATNDLYSRAIPGYAGGTPMDSSELSSWLVDTSLDRMPEAFRTRQTARTPGEPGRPAVPPAGPGFARTLSIYPRDTRTNLTQFLCYAVLFAVVTGYFRSKERLRRLLAMAVFTGFAVSIFGVIQRLTWNGKLFWIREGDYQNPFGPFVNRNSYAAFAGTILPVAFCLALGMMRQFDQRRPGALARVFLFAFAAVTMLGGIALSLSRGGMLSAVVSLAAVAAILVYYGRSGRDLGLLGILGALVIVFLAWVGPEKVIERVGTLSEGQSIPSMASRVGTWKRSLDMVAGNPLVGTGLGTYAFGFMRSAPPGEGWWTTAHNEYIELLCDTGLVGGAIFLGGLAAWLFIILRPGRFRERNDRFAFMGLLSGILGLLLHSAVSSNLQVPANALLLVVFGGALVCLVLITGNRRGTS